MQPDTIQRPALAAVLAHLTHDESDPDAKPPEAWVPFWESATSDPKSLPPGRLRKRVVCDEKGVAVGHASGAIDVRFCGPVPWTVVPARSYPDGRNDDGSVKMVDVPAHRLSPREALERLYEHGLYPWAPDDTSGPMWWCAKCQGFGWLPGWELCGCVRGETKERGFVDAPRAVADVLSVASLGTDALASNYEHAKAIASLRRTPNARVVWRVMSTKALREHHQNNERLSQSTRIHWSLDAINSREEYLRGLGNLSWPKLYAYDDPSFETTYPHLREIVVGGEVTPKPSGVHFILATEHLIVLGVEEIGGDQ